MKVLLDLPKDVLYALKAKADLLDRSRKNYMELILKRNAVLPSPPRKNPPFKIPVIKKQ